MCGGVMKITAAKPGRCLFEQGFFDNELSETSYDIFYETFFGRHTRACTMTTLTGKSFSVNAGQAVGLSSFVSLSNPANDSLGAYWVEDLGGGSGHLTVGGATVSDSQWVQVGGNLSNVQYVGGWSNGTDTLDVCVYDNATGSYVYSPTFQATTFHVAPTLTGQSFSVSLGQAVGLSSLVSLSNPANDSLGAYWVEDLGGGSGHLTVGGTTVSDGQWVQVGGNLSNVQYVGGSSNGADTLDVCVYDNTTGSYLYSQKFQATTYHVTPTLIGQSFSVSQGQAVGLSPFLSLSNPSNDSMGAYWVEDLGGGSGHLTVGGTAVSDNKWVQVGGNLSNVQYVGGSSNGADTLEICVYDNATGSYVYSQNFQATTNHVTPTLTGQSFSVNQGQTAGLSSFVSLSNSANDSMGAYWVEDLGGGSGHLTVGGTTVSDGQWVQVGSNLSSVQYVGGLSNGADTLEVCVYDNATGSYVYSPNFQATTTVTYNVLQPAAWNNGTWSAVNTSPSATWLYGATGTPQINAVNQGSLGDCWFLSSLEALDAMNSSRISNMISYVGNGIYGIKLYSGGVQQTVYVNDSLMSTVNNGNSNGNWASLIEKAYAAANGDAYATMDGNWPAVALQAFTGQASTDYTPSASTFNLAVSDLTGANAGNYEIELCSEYYDTPAGWKQFSSGSHAYAAVGYDQSTQCLVVANPWGQDSQSPYSGSAINTSYPSDMISSNGGSWYGMFEVSASAMSYFYKVTIDGPNVGPGSVASTGNQSAPLEQVTLNVPASSVGGGPGLEISGSSNAAISFSTNGGTLGLDASALFHGTLADFGTNDAIDLGDIAFDPGKTTLGYQANSASTGGMLLMGDGTHCAALALLGQYSAASFAASSDGHDGTLVTFVDHTTTPIPMLAQSHLHS